jgi:hypothetical protein
LQPAACVCPVSFSLVAGVCFEINSTFISQASKFLTLPITSHLVSQVLA